MHAWDWTKVSMALLDSHVSFLRSTVNLPDREEQKLLQNCIKTFLTLAQYAPDVLNSVTPTITSALLS